MRYWLFKTEPQVYSVADLAAAPAKLAWDGIRNFQARNFYATTPQWAIGCLSIIANARRRAFTA